MFTDMTELQYKLTTLTALYMLLAMIYVLLLCSIRKKNKYRFYFCEGSTRKIISVEPVSYRAYKHYDELYAYPVMHISENAIYFNVG